MTPLIRRHVRFANTPLNVMKGLLCYMGRRYGSEFDFGNIFILGKHGNRNTVVNLHKKWLNGELKPLEEPRRLWVLNNLSQLKGLSILFCHCNQNQRCHVDNYIEKLNEV